MESIYSVASNCSSVTYGNIAQHIKELVKDLFPNSFFKYEHISSEIAYRNIRRQLGENSKQNLAKRHKPYLIIRPMLSVPDDMYLYNTPLTSNFDYRFTNMNKDVMIPIIQDTEEGIGLSYRLNVDRMDFQISITVSTLIQQIDQYKALSNIVMWNRPFAKSLPMEFMIPRPIIATLAARQNIDISNELYATDIFLDYLNRHSRYPITYKMRNSTSLDEYFIYAKNEVLFTFEDFQLNEGSMKNMIYDSFEITFRVSAQFNLPGLYVLFGDRELKEKSMNEQIIATMKSGDLSFPLFTIENLFAEAELDNGFRKFTSSIMAMEPDPKTRNDITNFGMLLGDSFRRIVKMYYINKIPMETLSIIQLYKNGNILKEGEDYKVDWYKTELITFNPSVDDSYRMIIYVNTVKLNELIVEYQDKLAKDKPNITPN